MPAPSAAIFPDQCDIQALLLKPGRMRLTGSRNTTLELIAGALSGLSGLGRPMIDQTGLRGRYDFTLEWFGDDGAVVQSPAPEPQGPGFLEALRDQLGLKLEPGRAPVQFMVIDRVERPSEN